MAHFKLRLKDSASPRRLALDCSSDTEWQDLSLAEEGGNPGFQSVSVSGWWVKVGVLTVQRQTQVTRHFKAACSPSGPLEGILERPDQPNPADASQFYLYPSDLKALRAPGVLRSVPRSVSASARGTKACGYNSPPQVTGDLATGP